MVAIGKDTISYLAREADARAAGAAEIWAKVQWRYIAAAYKELAQIELARTPDAAGQIEVSMERAKDNPLGKAKLYLKQAARVSYLGLKENDPKRRDTLLAMAENHYLLHDRFVQLGRWRRSDPLKSEGETVEHPKLSCIHE